mmetsp:Transcript_38450/g.62304  ORF Transcript_38450/g.62304 Transcript_38450/m.62304 type:complete len:205 (-) Transcript_38450:156-770(-)
MILLHTLACRSPEEDMRERARETEASPWAVLRNWEWQSTPPAVHVLGRRRDRRLPAPRTPTHGCMRRGGCECEVVLLAEGVVGMARRRIGPRSASRERSTPHVCKYAKMRSGCRERGVGGAESRGGGVTPRPARAKLRREGDLPTNVLLRDAGTERVGDSSTERSVRFIREDEDEGGEGGLEEVGVCGLEEIRRAGAGGRTTSR